MVDEEELYALARRVGDCLAAHGHRLVTAESCTGGWIATCVTDVPGSSSWFDRGFVTYSNTAKIEMLGVADAIIATFGAVSEEAVRAMAEGALARSRADCAVAVTGIAGPSGATAGKPVGTVWFAWCRREAAVRTHRALCSGDRRSIRRQAVVIALHGILNVYRET